MASGAGVCAGEAQIENRSMLAIINRRLDMGSSDNGIARMIFETWVSPPAATFRASQCLHLTLGPEFAQLELLNLARSSQRKSLDQEPVPRSLVRGERGAQVGCQFLLVDDGARGGTDEGGDLFAPFFVR